MDRAGLKARVGTLARLGGVGCLLRFSVEGDVSRSPESRRVSQ